MIGFDVEQLEYMQLKLIEAYYQGMIDAVGVVAPEEVRDQLIEATIADRDQQIDKYKQTIDKLKNP